MIVQLAFNRNVGALERSVAILRRWPDLREKVIIEIGNPLLKVHGLALVHKVMRLWHGPIFIDAKITDGFDTEIGNYPARAYVSVLARTDLQTVKRAAERPRVVIDLLGERRSFDLFRRIRARPYGVMLHLGRDEENAFDRFIQFREAGKLKSKYGIKIWMGGGFDAHNFQSGFFNGADVVIINYRDGPWKGFRIADLPQIIKTLRGSAKRQSPYNL